MTRPDDPASGPSLNLPALLSIVDNDHDLLRELLGIFKEEFPPILQSLQTALETGDGQGIKTTAHNLKGMLASVAFVRATASAARLEHMGEGSDTLCLSEELASLKYETSLALAEFEALCTTMIE